VNLAADRLTDNKIVQFSALDLRCTTVQQRYISAVIPKDFSPSLRGFRDICTCCNRNPWESCDSTEFLSFPSPLGL